MTEPIAQLPSSITNLPASFGLRFLAKLLDFLIINLVSIALFCAFPFFQAAGLSSVNVAIWLVSIFIVILVTYFTLWTSGGRQTLGYRAAGLLVVRTGPPDSTRSLNIGRALGRTLINLICLALLQYVIGLIDYLPVAFTRAKRALHDLAVGASVVRISPMYCCLLHSYFL